MKNEQLANRLPEHRGEPPQPVSISIKALRTLHPVILENLERLGVVTRTARWSALAFYSPFHIIDKPTGADSELRYGWTSPKAWAQAGTCGGHAPLPAIKRLVGFFHRVAQQGTSEEALATFYAYESQVPPELRRRRTVTLIYDHHTRLVPEKLTDLQHAHHGVVISTLHAHLDGDSCLEVVLLRGKSRDVQRFGGSADQH